MYICSHIYEIMRAIKNEDCGDIYDKYRNKNSFKQVLVCYLYNNSIELTKKNVNVYLT